MGSTVSLCRADSYDPTRLRQGLETLLEPLGGMGRFVKPGDRVLLKPNLLVETADAIKPDLTIADGIIGHAGNGPSGGYPHPLGVLSASGDCFALDLTLARVLAVDPDSIPTITASRTLGMLTDEGAIAYPLCRPQELAVAQWPLPSRIKPIDFGAPRIIRSSLKHLYIRLIKEPIALYTRK